MPAGNKKKKKPAAANPARGFATTSLQSKAQVEAAIDAEKAADSTEEARPVTNAEESPLQTNDTAKKTQDRELSDLSPEEFAAHLENSELQIFVEKHASRVRKEALRQVSRLQTDKRLLRGQADFMSVKDWLPKELMQQILELILEDFGRDAETVKQQDLPKHDDLVSKVWSLQLVLTDLDLPKARIREAISYVLKYPAVDEPGNHTWGVSTALEWLALHCDDGELDEYDMERKLKNEHVADDEEAAESSDNLSHEGSKSWKKRSSPGMIDQSGLTVEDLDIDVSDLESDLEPDELLSTYIRTKVRLYAINPSAADCGPIKRAGKGQKPESASLAASSGERKLVQKLQKIDSDILFDKRQADAEWANKRIELTRESVDRKRLQLDANGGGKALGLNGDSHHSQTTTDEAEKIGQELLMETEDLDGGDDMLSGMFSALPGVSDEPADSGNDPASTGPVKVRDFGKLTGVNPKRVLEEACRARDSRCRVSYKQVSPTTYSCRHAVTVQWGTAQQQVSSEYLPAVAFKAMSKKLTVTMIKEAAPEVAQSEAYAATAALFLIFADSPKEEKAHMRLPPAYRDLWDEFTKQKTDHIDSLDRETVKQIRALIEAEVPTDADEDDDVVFNANLRRLNGNASGSATPTSRSLTPRPDHSEAAEALKDLWARKCSADSYQRMLLARQQLPMFQAKETAMNAIACNQITIVVGDTGSGKSTQVPQFILEHELSQGRHCKIYCTEPRRISAISLAQRVSEELGERKGDVGAARSLVGYAIRLESHTAASTRLVFATVGIVLRMLENADGLKEITHLVLDEVHERSIDTDFLLIVLRTLVTTRPDLKVVLMSATVDAQKFSNYLDGAPIVSVPGRTFPVGAKFLEDAIELTGHTNEDASTKDTGDDDDADVDPADGKTSAKQSLAGYSAKTRKTLSAYDEYRIDHALIVKLLEKVAYDANYKDFSKAILVFLPGIAEIRQLNDMLVGHPSFSKDWRVHALHSSFSSEDQQAAFENPPPGVRKIVLATNIAETGITIPDVTCVIDTGKHREMRFDERRQMSRLIQSFVARANAKQRRGRAGRVQEGICFHLFTKHRFENLMIDQQTPEMLRLSLQDLVMRVKICKLGNIEDALSQALDPPSSKNIRRAIDALVEVGALTESEHLTPLGTQLAKLPLDAQLGKLLLLGATFNCLDFAATTAAALSAKSPFLTPMHARKQADSVRLGFKRGDSDLLTTYNAYAAWRRICTTPHPPGGGGLSEPTFCAKNFLSAPNLANIEDLKAQLITALVDAGVVALSPAERTALTKVRPTARHRHFVTLPAKYTTHDANDLLCCAVAAWSFYPKILKPDGRGWRNIANNQSLGLHPTSVNKHHSSHPHDSSAARYLSFYSILQSSSRFTNAQETSAVSDFALLLLAGEAAAFHVYAGVVVVDGMRLRVKVRDWRTLVLVKVLRARAREVVGRLMRVPGKEVGGRLGRWREVVERVFGRRVEGRV